MAQQPAAGARRLALISVYDKSRIFSLSRALIERGIEILATEGTAKALREDGIPCITTHSYTGIQQEVFDRQVKTLHPRIAGGILWDRAGGDTKHFEGESIDAIDFVVVQAYPFRETAQREGIGDDEVLRRMVDIGGISLLRAAAKNYVFVSAVCDAKDFSALEEILRSGQRPNLEYRRVLAAKAFRMTASYDLMIAEWLGESGGDEVMPLSWARVAERCLLLRYGENPHQSAGLYGIQRLGVSPIASDWSPEVKGRVFSYNNLLDAYAGVRFTTGVSEVCCAIIKHGAICGCAYASTMSEAFSRAYAADSVSAFGGVVVFNGSFSDVELARELKDKKFFTLVVAKEFSDSVAGILGVGRSPLLLPYPELRLDRDALHEVRSVGGGGLLLQTVDDGEFRVGDMEERGERLATSEQREGLCFAFRIARHEPSNAVAIVRGGVSVALGYGQGSRIDSVRVAIMKAERLGHDLGGAVAASDGFFPFTDCIEELAGVGVGAVLCPGGGRNEGDIIEAANRCGVALLSSGVRAFRH